MSTPEEVSELVRAQLAQITDENLRTRIARWLVPPYPSERAWDYGRPEEKFVCWIVFEHRKSNTAIAYCAEGFGPKNPWGLLFLHGEGPQMSMGMDSGWYDTLEWAFRESFASEEPNQSPETNALHGQ